MTQRLTAFAGSDSVRRLLPAFVGVAALGGAALAWSVLSPAPQRLLYSDLDDSDRAAITPLLDQAGIRPMVVAEVDDMAMLRLIAREADALTLVPPVVVRDELRSKTLVERCRIPQLRESFFAIVPSRRFPNPLVRELLAQRIDGALKKRDKPL